MRKAGFASNNLQTCFRQILPEFSPETFLEKFPESFRKPSRKVSQKHRLKLVRNLVSLCSEVTTTFSATEENQLSLKKGDSVEIVDKNPNGWTYCRIPATGAEGWFPHNFLKVED